VNAIALQDRRYRWLGALVAAYLLAAGAVMWLWQRWLGVNPGAFEAAICALPGLVGAGLAATATSDAKQYVARLLAGAGFLPVLLLFWGTSMEPQAGAAARAVWPFAVGAALGHALAFVGLIFWGGSFVTRVTPAPGAPFVGVDVLRERLLSLNQLGLALSVHDTGAPGLAVALRLPDAATRSHVVTLGLSAAQRRVQVREKILTFGARPANADEASMRSIGDAAFDPTRPDASSVSGVMVQTSMIDMQRLAAMPLTLLARSVELPRGLAATLDADGLCTLMCAVVTRSGWAWQPQFLARDQG
jgi:hypothetical protein